MSVPSIRRILAPLAGFTILAVCFAATLPLRAQSSQSAAPNGLEGSWIVSVSVFDCTTLTPKGNFTSLLMFSRGGSVTETTSNPAFLPGQRSIGIGTWDKASDGSYSASDLAFIIFSGGHFQAGTQKLTHTITLTADGTQWNDQALVNFYDVTGAPIAAMHACATATAKRL
jgi:hypothetical protein